MRRIDDFFFCLWLLDARMVKNEEVRILANRDVKFTSHTKKGRKQIHKFIHILDEVGVDVTAYADYAEKHNKLKKSQMNTLAKHLEFFGALCSSVANEHPNLTDHEVLKTALRYLHKGQEGFVGLSQRLPNNDGLFGRVMNGIIQFNRKIEQTDSQSDPTRMNQRRIVN